MPSPTVVPLPTLISLTVRAPLVWVALSSKPNTLNTAAALLLSAVLSLVSSRAIVPSRWVLRPRSLALR
ncbi:hypothetical protein D3C77_785520 [compost metagenome]